MAFSYSGITNYGKTTLPSIESWNTNMSILRDPTKSITTRKIDKVGDNNSITQMIDDSGNRICESINTYARGVNPMVSVSFNNYGNNGGQNSGNITSVSSKQQAYPASTIMRYCEFRPPLIRPVDLLPSSRKPRLFTSVNTQMSSVDFSKKLRECASAEKTKEVKTQMLSASVRPTAVYKLETPISEPFEIKYVIQPSIKVSGNSGIRTMDRTTQHVLEPTKEVNRNMVYAFANVNYSDNHKYINNNTKHTDSYIQDANIHAFANSNYSDKHNYINNNTKHTDSYIQDANTHAVYSNLGSNLNITNIEDIIDMSDIKVKDIHTINYNTPLSGNEKTEYIHDDIDLSRNLPEYNSRTNIGRNIYKNIEYENSIELQRNTPLTNISINPGDVKRGENDISSRDYRLNPKINPGGYSIPTQIPMQERMQNVRNNIETDKSRMGKLVSAQFEGRYSK